MLTHIVHRHTVAVLAALLPFGASAELLPEAYYAEELQRCVSEIRSALEVERPNAVGDLRHEVKNVERARMWYEFEITTMAAELETGAARTQTCRAYRYEPRALLDISSASSTAPQLAQQR